MMHDSQHIRLRLFDQEMSRKTLINKLTKKGYSFASCMPLGKMTYMLFLNETENNHHGKFGLAWTD